MHEGRKGLPITSKMLSVGYYMTKWKRMLTTHSKKIRKIWYANSFYLRQIAKHDRKTKSVQFSLSTEGVV